MSANDGTSPAPGGPFGLPAAGLRLAAALAARPLPLLHRTGGWVAELGRIGLGTSTLGPGDTGTGATAALQRRAGQVLLATTGALRGLVDDAGTGPDHPLPPADAERLHTALAGVARLLVPGAGPDATGGSAPAADHPVTEADGAVLDPAARSTSVPADHPVSETDGAELDPTARSTPVPADHAAAGAPPATGAEIVFTAPGPDDPDVPYDTGARDSRGGPVAGRDLAVTPGAVVLRTPVFELLQYLPVTERVYDTPVLVVPPLLHRFWLADLTPGYSMVEHLLARGLQVFALSWRPAGPADAGRDLDAHAAAVLDAMEACTRITRAARLSMLGVRTGGLLAAAVQAHQAAIGLDDRVAAVGYLATVLDPSDALPGFAPDPAVVAAATEQATRDGVLDGASAVAAWAWRRGPDRVLPWAARSDGGRTEQHGCAARAMRAWTEDLLPLPATLHADLVALADGAADVRVLGTPVRLAELRRDGYLVAAGDDPVQPWTGGYRTSQMLGGVGRLVLAPGDQAGVLIAPPAVAGSFRVASCDTGDGDAQRWRSGADVVDGSWWDDLATWLTERSGALRDAPPELGGRRMRPVFPAPGTYLTEQPVIPDR